MSKHEWVPDRNPKYIRLTGYKDVFVRTKPTPSGRYLYQAGQHYDYAADVEAAKEMAEGCALVLGLEPAQKRRGHY